MKIYLLRHGRTADNEARRYQGRRDTPLSSAGAAALVAADFTPETVWVSPLLRARQTAAILFPGVRQKTAESLREMDFGDFEGRSADEMLEDTAYRAWVEGGCLAPCPNGEGREGFSRRVCAEISALVAEALRRGKDRLVIVAHGGVQMAALERFALPKRDFYGWNGPYGGGFLLETDEALWQEGRFRLLETICYAKEEQP